MKHRGIHIIIYMAATLLLLASCGSSRKTTVVRPTDNDIVLSERNKPKRHNGEPVFDVDSRLAEKIVKTARKWLGTPYRYGGKDRKGTDCSGMTMSVFGEAAAVALPRNSAAQYEYCVSIGHEDLQPGDLVFFCGKRGGPVNHVGLYIGERRMIHASSSRGVIESSLDERYWLTHYYGSGRVNAVTYAMTGGKSSRKSSKKAAASEVPARVDPQPADYAIAEDKPELNQAVEPIPAVVEAQVVPEQQEQPEQPEKPQSLSDSDESPTADEISNEVKAAFGSK